MSLLVLLATAGSLGLLGGLHCVAMCSGLQRIAIHGLQPVPAAKGPSRSGPHRVVPLHAVATIGPIPAQRAGVTGAIAADLRFHAARLFGYAMLGAVVGSGSWLLRWGVEVLPLMRPLWGSLNAALLALGLSLLLLGRQPAWIDALGERVWRATGSRAGPAVRHRPELAGIAWAALPCGLLYSALATAALASDPLGGAAAMLAFGAGTAINLLAAQAVMRALGRGSAARVESIGMRIGGALLAAMAIAALRALALGQPHPFCVS